MEMESANGSASGLETRPGILLIGSPNVGKRTLLSQLLSTEIPDTHDLSTGVLCQGWSIDTKYYSADVSIWTADLNEEFSLNSLPNNHNLNALIMIFDMSEQSSLRALENFVTKTDIKKFEILLCIANKADLMPGHQAHVTYKRRLQARNESSSDPFRDYSDFGIYEEEGSSLLYDEDNKIEDFSKQIRNASLNWCMENNIEYIEACASNKDFDKCLSVDGDMQGVERVYGAICAHMWPGMILKSGNKIPAPILPDIQESSEEEDFEIEYETLSHGSDDTWNNIPKPVPADASSSEPTEFSDFVSASNQNTQNTDKNEDTNDNENIINESTSNKDEDEDNYEEYGLDNMEKVMSEIGNVRDNLRLMPDFQRRDMAAKLAMRMAAMFGGLSDDDE